MKPKMRNPISGFWHPLGPRGGGLGGLKSGKPGCSFWIPCHSAGGNNPEMALFVIIGAQTSRMSSFFKILRRPNGMKPKMSTPVSGFQPPPLGPRGCQNPQRLHETQTEEPNFHCFPGTLLPRNTAAQEHRCPGTLLLRNTAPQERCSPGTLLPRNTTSQEHCCPGNTPHPTPPAVLTGAPAGSLTNVFYRCDRISDRTEKIMSIRTVSACRFDPDS